MNLLLVGFLLYLTAIVVIGIKAYRATSGPADYLLGARRLTPWVSALSAGASDMSGWLLLGLPGLAYVSSMEASWVAVGLFCGTYLNWRWVAAPLRTLTVATHDSLTLPEFFEHRFNQPYRPLRYVSAALILLFFVFYTASGFVAAGKLFNAAFAIDYHQAVLAGGTVVVAYTLFGGFLAVSWTDALQACLMAAALVAIAIMASTAAPASEADQLRAFHTTASAGTVSTIVVLSSIAWGLGYFGQPHILARFMAIESVDAVRPARRLAVTWTGLTLVAAIAVGIGGHLALPGGLTDADREQVFIRLVGTLLHPALAGLCLAAILAAIMSTADSQLLVAASALTHDILQRSGDNGSSVAMHRLAVAAVSVVALFIAMDPASQVLDMVAYAWAGFGAAFGPCVLAAIYRPQINPRAPLMGMLAGAAVVVGWRSLDGGIFDLYEIVPGFVAGVLALGLTNRFFAR